MAFLARRLAMLLVLLVETEVGLEVVINVYCAVYTRMGAPLVRHPRTRSAFTLLVPSELEIRNAYSVHPGRLWLAMATASLLIEAATPPRYEQGKAM